MLSTITYHNLFVYIYVRAYIFINNYIAMYIRIINGTLGTVLTVSSYCMYLH